MEEDSVDGVVREGLSEDVVSECPLRQGKEEAMRRIGGWASRAFDFISVK